MTTLSVDDLVQRATERIAEKHGPEAGIRAGRRLRAILLRTRPQTVGEAVSIMDGIIREEDRNGE